MRIGVLKETTPRERRVALTPEAVAKLVKAGDQVVVERDAGAAAFFPDALYAAAGATIGSAADAGSTDLVCAVRRPDPSSADRVAEGATLVAMVGPDSRDALEALARRRVTVLALERVPRITRAQSMDVLSSQATVAGYQAVLIGAGQLPKFLPMLTTAAGSITPARVLVLGAGVAGLQAIATARRLGGMVTGFDIRPAAAEQVLSLGAKFLAPDAISGDAETKGGYAKELAEEQQKKVLEAVGGAVPQADLVISTAAIPGRAAPRLITREMVEAMKPGSVIVDVAAETGGNCELTRPGETVMHGDVTVLGPLNLPATMPLHASQMFGRNVQTLIEHLRHEGALRVALDDEITGAMCVVHDGALRQQGG
ncbi:MAG TPA: Re/Si-specific NAD(P)(+) transhydrogenase subunit alpha [Gemmatimonadales bacterium]|nr:Re/Si-specific NAD(P)(+) transhydrogenase subunit alpha [Gemmatimonadales bacterium]